ncbi:MAG: HyaD/HybD family hydrogenase maturation endopeptidase [Candidatus Marinimicrobia bacterium]|nr:HyaD/HybD family hydrogenase maturation endopeptidase [Candidatus Neomarinimicrobiota bacterium]MCF7921081.1 HyaD/HybD family hydrogenase maturation endopeptidase [Candidatus Neomarinimicrobiota bacterium]
MSFPDVVVLGLGNLLLQDEGVGIHALRILQENYLFTPQIELVDGGTSGLDLLQFFRPESKMIMLDAMLFEQSAGSIGRVENEDIHARLNTKTSVHHLGLSDLLAIAKLTDVTPREIVLFGVQPESMELKVELTKTVNDAIPKLMEYVIQQLGEWDVKTSTLKNEGKGTTQADW